MYYSLHPAVRDHPLHTLKSINANIDAKVSDLE